MEFGRVENLENIDFLLAPDEIIHKNSTTDFEIYLGAPIWGHKEMIESLEPHVHKSKEALAIYAKSFNCIELNSTYYAILQKEQIHKWCEQTPNDFLFFPKASKDLTFHTYQEIPQKLLKEFFCSIEHFQDRLGDCFFQFSPYVGYKDKAYLFAFLKALPAEFKIHIELRSEDWFANPDSLKRLADYLAKKKLGFCITDTAGRRDVCHMKFTSSHAMIRFTGNDLAESDFKRIDQWLAFFHQRQESFSRLIFFHHHPNEKNCIDSIEYMIDKLSISPVNRLEKPIRKQSQNSLF